MTDLLNRNRTYCLLLLISVVLGGCAGRPYVDPAGSATRYVDVNGAGIGGLGIESRDVVQMTDKMVERMLQNPLLGNRTPPPRIIIDSTYFSNRSSSRIDKDIITDRLRVALNRAANGRLIFLARHYGDMVSSERELKRENKLTTGSFGMAGAQAGADFRLGGRISSRDGVGSRSGYRERFHQIVFEMIDLETGMIVWNDIYDFKKQAREDVVYR